MVRKRVTQVFPALQPLRKWQRKKLFYLKMRFDGNQYAQSTAAEPLPNTVYEASFRMMNENSGYGMVYQHNKVHNLKIAAKTIHGVLIRPGETFSFWQLVRQADRKEKYREGLNLVDGKVVGVYGGGLCLLSDLLFWLFLHTPLTVTERHGHAVEAFPSTSPALPCGTDATVSEGWLDLKARNETENTFQIQIFFEGEEMHGQILSEKPVQSVYEVFNPFVSYKRQNGVIVQTAPVWRRETNPQAGKNFDVELYVNRCRIGYELPQDVKIEEEDAT